MSIPEPYQEGCAKLAMMLSRSEVRQQIVQLLVQGKSRKAIADALQRSPHTIDAHIKALYRGVGVGDRAHLVVLTVLLFRFGNFSPPPRNWGLANLGYRLNDALRSVGLAVFGVPVRCKSVDA